MTCALVGAGILAGCASKPAVAPANKQVTTNFKPGVPGGSYVETYQTDATLIRKNPDRRQMTFRAVDGSTNTFTAGPKFRNYDAYQVGDRLRVSLVRELVVWFAPDAPPPAADVAAMARNQPGAQPGVLTAPTVEITARVLAANPEKHEATLRLSDGRTVTFRVRPDIDLAQVKVGAAGSIRISAAMAVMVEGR